MRRSADRALVTPRADVETRSDAACTRSAAVFMAIYVTAVGAFAGAIQYFGG